MARLGGNQQHNLSACQGGQLEGLKGVEVRDWALGVAWSF